MRNKKLFGSHSMSEIQIIAEGSHWMAKTQIQATDHIGTVKIQMRYLVHI